MTSTYPDPTLPATTSQHLVTEAPRIRGNDLTARNADTFTAGMGCTTPVYVDWSGDGVVADFDGNRLIDMGAGSAAITSGRDSRHVARAAPEQASALTHASSSESPNDGCVAVAEALNRLTPGSHGKRTVLYNSSVEAVERAVEGARSYTGRQAVAVFDSTYHGRTSLTLEMTSKARITDSLLWKPSFATFAPEIYRAPSSYPFRDHLDGPTAAARVIDMLEYKFGSAGVAAVVIEPIHSDDGVIEPASGFLPAVAEWCRSTAVVFIANEVHTGYARTGDMFACDREGVVPDLIVTAPGITSGSSLGAVTGRSEMMDAVRSWDLAGPLGGSPSSFASALAALATIDDAGLLTKVRHIERFVIERLRWLQAGDSRVGDVRGRGAMIGVELVESGTHQPDPVLAQAVARYAHHQGVIVLTCGAFGNVLRLLPPLAVTDALLGEAIFVLESALRTVK